MRQNFKRWYYHFITDPALLLMLPFWPLYILGMRLSRPILWFPVLLILLALAFWQKFCRIDIGQNFQALPALPGGYRTIGQRKQKGARAQTCRELRRTLLQDSWEAANHIPPGNYQALTHETVLRRIERSNRIRVDLMMPIYMGTLQPVLNAQTNGRCRHCKATCSAWNAPQRQFYLVRFRVIN